MAVNELENFEDGGDCEDEDCSKTSDGARVKMEKNRYVCDNDAPGRRRTRLPQATVETD